MMPTLVAIASLILGLAIVAVIELGVLMSQLADLKAYVRTAISLLQQLSEGRYRRIIGVMPPQDWEQNG